MRKYKVMVHLKKEITRGAIQVLYLSNSTIPKQKFIFLAINGIINLTYGTKNYSPY